MKMVSVFSALLFGGTLWLGLPMQQAQAQKGGARGASVARAPAARPASAPVIRASAPAAKSGAFATPGLSSGIRPITATPGLSSGIRPIASGGIATAGLGSGIKPITAVSRPVTGIGTGAAYQNNQGRRNGVGVVIGGSYWTDPYYGFGGNSYPGFGYAGYGYGLGGYADPYFGMPGSPPAGYLSGAYPPVGGNPPIVVYSGRTQVPTPEPEPGPMPTTTSASVQVVVPSANAELWFNGVRTQTMGQQRDFVTPELPPGKVFSYEVRARWVADGKEYDQTRIVNVQAGAQSILNFMNDSREQLPQPQAAVMPPAIKM